eukprot:CAMPEP_0117601070 /NCGR_PEP_ID=MMETSP0784-20121206/76833_1 /TAXON_ID=39447 /ORGANISM="" /LENGTH=334 /DNA_ID=CAMNT_0005403761 /DNA_START=68 /DNA_END=1070 /DNA_ORIENTATION=-
MAKYGSTHATFTDNYDYAGFAAPGKDDSKAVLQGPRRERMNIFSLVLSVLVPWILFAVVLALMSSYNHFARPKTLLFGVLCVLAVVVCFGVFAADSAKKKSAGDPRRSPNWYAFLFMTSALAWVTGVVVGEWNYIYFSEPAFKALDLQTYTSIDVSQVAGTQLMDAGIVTFEEGTLLAGYKNGGRTFCVAPITMRNTTIGSFDFWAVGVDCCSAGSVADFHCFDPAWITGFGGLRQVGSNDDIQNYHFAVVQAEAMYGIQVRHALYFKWVHDPLGIVSSWQDVADSNVFRWMIYHGVLQICLVAIAAVAFSQAGLEQLEAGGGVPMGSAERCEN